MGEREGEGEREGGRENSCHSARGVNTIAKPYSPFPHL